MATSRRYSLDELAAAAFVRQAQRLGVLADLREMAELSSDEAAAGVPMARNTLLAWEAGHVRPWGPLATKYGSLLLSLLPVVAVDDVAAAHFTARLHELAAAKKNGEAA